MRVFVFDTGCVRPGRGRRCFTWSWRTLPIGHRPKFLIHHLYISSLKYFRNEIPDTFISDNNISLILFNTIRRKERDKFSLRSLIKQKSAPASVRIVWTGHVTLAKQSWEIVSSATRYATRRKYKQLSLSPSVACRSLQPRRIGKSCEKE